MCKGCKNYLEKVWIIRMLCEFIVVFYWCWVNIDEFVCYFLCCRLFFDYVNDGCKWFVYYYVVVDKIMMGCGFFIEF